MHMDETINNNELDAKASEDVLDALDAARASVVDEAMPGMTFEELHVTVSREGLTMASQNRLQTQALLRRVLQQLCAEGLVARVNGWAAQQYISTRSIAEDSAGDGHGRSRRDSIGEEMIAKQLGAITPAGDPAALLKAWLTIPANRVGFAVTARSLAQHGVPSSSVVKLDGAPHLLLLRGLRRAALALVVHAPGLSEANLQQRLSLVSPLEVSILLDGLVAGKALECRRVPQARIGGLFGDWSATNTDRCFFCAPHSMSKLREMEMEVMGTEIDTEAMGTEIETEAMGTEIDTEAMGTEIDTEVMGT
jgi:hypothetical protein